LPRRKKQEIKLNDNSSLEGLVQEIYNDACLQITESQKTINELSVNAIGENVGEHTQIAKEKGGLLKVKESGIRLKLEVAKLQSDIIKHSGNIEVAVSERSQGTASITDFKSIRDMLKNEKNNEIANEFESE
jgi:hypothetical protein